MKEKIKGFSDLRLVGREVYVRDVEMVIIRIDDGQTICRKKENGGQRSFWNNGRWLDSDLLPSLSFTPYTVTINENGQVIIKGYSDEIELEDENEPKVGDFGWFWDDEGFDFIYGKLYGVNLYYYFGSIGYKNFSKTCPEWIKQIINK